MSVILAAPTPTLGVPRAPLALPGLGLAVVDPPFTPRERLVARLVAAIPWRLRSALLYNDTRLCMPAQLVVQRLLGGRRSIRARFTTGRLRDQEFESLTSEKYFLMGARYENSLQRRLSEMVLPGDVVYDVGAHAGYWALLFATAAGPAGAVFAFEPSPDTFARLCRNVGETPRIIPVHAAASDTEGDALLAERGSESRVVTSASAAVGRTSAIRLLRLDDFVYRDGHRAPTFVKIDVEGHAVGVLRGMRRVIERARPRLMIEVHDPAEAAGVRQLLLARAYRVTPIERRQRFPRHVLGMPLPR